jgi:DNA-binding CsgD family transcriptional regulator/tetratricopeptide (TPR) repeat protein
VPPSKRASAGEHAWLSEFESAFSQARFADAAQNYDRHESRPEASRVSLKAAQAHMHASPAAALRILLGIRENRVTRRESVVRDALLAEAFARTKDFDSADERLASALRSARSLRDADLVSIVGYRYVRRNLLADDPITARSYMDLAGSGASRISRVYALYAETLILPYEERLREQAARLLELLRMLHPSDAEFTDLRAWSTHTLAGLAREFFIPGAATEIERQLDGVPWPEDFAPNRFQTLKALAWSKALQGDYFSAFRLLKSASSIVPSEPWRVVAACDRAYLAQSFGENRWSRVELEDAEDLARTVDWVATRGEERVGLLLLAELVSGFDAPRAASYLGRYRELNQIASPLYHGRDARLGAFADYSAGVVDLALGKQRQGLNNMQKALAIFERYGYDFRAARCLAAAWEVRGDPDLRERALAKLRDFGQSWLAARLHARTETRVDLPPMQRLVLEHMCRGESTSQIADVLGRSRYTVSNHIKQIFKAFGVNTRAALLAKALRREYD